MSLIGKKPNPILTILPSLGILLFIGLYIYAASLYPGGSQADSNSIGFDWVNNYWCNLMNIKAMNGMENPAKPVAILAMIVLCSSLVLFFFHFSRHFVKNRIWQVGIPISGSLAMISAAFLFTSYHDILIIVSSVFGAFAVIGIILTIYKSDLTIFRLTGAGIILLLGINNLIYYSGEFIEYLPLIQKVTFVLVFSWIIGLNLQMRNKNGLQ